MEPANAKPKRNWRQFSLRTLLLAITVVGVWLGIQVNSARKQKVAVNAIQKAGGDLYFDYQEVPVPAGTDALFAVDPTVSPCAPEWLRDQFGEDYFRTPITVSLFQRQIAQSDLMLLEDLSAIRQLQLDHTVVTNGSGIQRPVEDNDLLILKVMSRLVQLSLGHTTVDGSGLKYLAMPKQLHDLDCQHTKVNDSGMEQVGKLTGLRTLCLNSTAVTDIGLERIQNLTMLEGLYLDNTQITDAGLTSIMKLKRLTVISLSGTDVTPDGIRVLKKALPHSQITAPLSFRMAD